MIVKRNNGRKKEEEGKLCVEPILNLQLHNQLRPVGEQAPLSVVDSNGGE